jgi:hypothetical protein
VNQTRTIDAIVSRMSPDQYAALVAFAEKLVNPVSHRFDPEEEALACFLRTPIPEELRENLRELTEKSEAETLTDAERIEYLRLAEQIETEQAARLEAAIQLAALRGVEPMVIIREFGIGVEASA